MVGIGDDDDDNNGDVDGKGNIGKDNVVIRGVFCRSGCTDLLLQRTRQSSLE